MRVSELLGVRAVDLHLDEHYLTCIGKGNKERLIPIGEQAAAWIRAYQRDGRPALLKGRSATRAVRQRAGRPLSRVGFWKILKAYGRPRAAAALAEPARAQAFVRDAPAGARRRPARHPDDARPRRSLDHADLHARPRGAAEDDLRSFPPALVIWYTIPFPTHSYFQSEGAVHERYRTPFIHV